MNPMRTMNKPTSHKSRFVLPLLIAATLATAACQGPEVVALGNTYPAPDGAEYDFDVLMLAEWSGYVLPAQSTIKLKVKVDGNAVTSAEDSHKDVSLDSVFKIDSGNKTASYLPFGTDSDVHISCECRNDCDNPERTYYCPVYQSGAAAIAETWAKIFGDTADRSHTLVIGSGDDFGTSQPLSAYYKDLPAVHLLTQFGMTADTLGNHNFDSNLKYLNRLLALAGYPHVVSNLYNVPNNLEFSAQYTVANIPASGAGANALPVAIVGVIDPGLISIIGRGHFGGMEIKDYCELVNTMEEAYNKNARVFVLLSHVMTDAETVRDFFHAVFSLDKSFAKQLQNARPNDPYPCSSRLFVSQEMLDAYRTQPGKEKATADDVRAQMREDILHGIAMVYAETNATPILTPMVPGSGIASTLCTDAEEVQHIAACTDPYLEYPINGCNGGNQLPMITASSRLSKACDPSARSTALPITSVYSYDLHDFEKNDAPHPLWFAELPKHGTHTAKANFKVVADTPIPGLTSRYRVQMDAFRVEPVFDTGYEANDKGTCDTILSAPDIPASCRANFEDWLVVARETYLAEKCAKEDDAVCEKKHTDIMNGIKTRLTEENANYSSCALEMLGVVAKEDSTGSKVKKIRDIQNAWECLYMATRWEWDDAAGCPDLPEDGSAPSNDAECYAKAYVCKLGTEDVDIESEHKDNDIRKYSTFIVNMLTTMVLDYAQIHYSDDKYFKNASANKKPDVLYINAGTIRESIAFQDIDDDILSTALPFDNDVVITRQSVDILKRLIEHGLNYGGGAFPAVAGIHFSYVSKKTTTTEENGEPKEAVVNEVREIWQTDIKENFTALLYVSEDLIQEVKKNTTVCIFGLKGTENENECRIGHYQMDNTSVQAVLNPCNEDKFGCVIADNKKIFSVEPKELNIVMTSYAYTGGDEYSKVLTSDMRQNETAPQSKIFIRSIVKGLLTNKEQCAWKEGFSNKDLLKDGLVKRIYTDQTVHGTADDTPNSYCVATQKEFATKLLGDDYDFCDYEE